jgi:hypothetical protein
LLADEAEELDRAGCGGPEPMWGAGAELGDFSRFKDEVVFAEEYSRTLTNRAGRAVQLHDVVVRATRRP